MPWHIDGSEPVLTYGEQDALAAFLETERVDAAVQEALDSFPKG